MTQMDISKARASDMTNTLDTAKVPSMSVDKAQQQKETEWMNPDWMQNWGYFNDISDLKSAILLKAIWDVGKGWTASTEDTALLEGITGWGKDTWDEIIYNMEVIKRINGDAFAEIIRNNDGVLINLKPLDPGSLRYYVNRKGILIRYEETEMIGDKVKVLNTWNPNEIFHLSNNRLANQIHGISDIESLTDVVLAEKESFDDLKIIQHRQAKPLIMFKLGTDKQSVIDAFIVKMDAAINKGEHIYVPADKETVDWEVIQANVGQVVMQWRDDIRNKFYRTIGLPQIVPGGAGQSTESESKAILLAFEQIVHKDQGFLEKQIWSQLAIRIDFIHPASIAPGLQADTAKDTGQLGFQPNETTAGVGA